MFFILKSCFSFVEHFLIWGCLTEKKKRLSGVIIEPQEFDSNPLSLENQFSFYFIVESITVFPSSPYLAFLHPDPPLH